MDDDDNGGSNVWMDMMKAKLPQFLNQYFNLTFSQESSLFVPWQRSGAAQDGLGTAAGRG